MDILDSLSTAPEADAVPALGFELITDDGESGNLWCEQCKVYKKNYEKLQEEHALSYNTLKKKIISTDLLIKKYKTKCEDYDQQARALDEAVKRQQQQQRETDTLQAQLSAALRQMEPLKQEKIALDQEMKRKLHEIQSLRDQVVSGESFKMQYEQLNKSLLATKEKQEQEVKDANKRTRELELSQQRQETLITKLKEDNKGLKKENSKIQKKEKKTEEILAKTQETVNQYKEILIKHGLLPKQDRCRGVKKESGIGGTTEDTHLYEEGDWCDPGPFCNKVQNYDVIKQQKAIVADRKSETVSTEARTKSETVHTVERTKSETVYTEEKTYLTEIQEEDGSLQEFPFTFSPLASVLSPLPPSPQSYRKEVEDDESDDDLDKMAEQLEQEFTNASPPPRRSPRKHVPQSPLSKDPNSTVLLTQNESSSQNTSSLKQKTVHDRKGGMVRGNQEGALGGNDRGLQELKGIKRITFTGGESPHTGDMEERRLNSKVVKDVKKKMNSEAVRSVKGGVVSEVVKDVTGRTNSEDVKRSLNSEVAVDLEGSLNSEVAVVNPKPILSGHQNSAFQKFSKSSDKQEKCRGKSVLPQLSGETVTTADCRFICDKSKSLEENNINIHHKRTECLEKHAFRPVIENLEDSDSMSATETEHRTKDNERPCSSSRVKDEMKIQCEKETITDQQAGKSNRGSDKEAVLSVRTLRKSLSLPEGELSPHRGKVRQKRNMSLSQRSPGRDFDSSDLKVKTGHDSPRRSLRNKMNCENKQKCTENSDACMTKRTNNAGNSLSKFASPKPPSRLTRSQTLQVPTDELDSLCQRSRSRMKIPSGKKRKEEESGNVVERRDIKEEDEESDEVEEGVKEDRRRTTRAMSRQDSLGFVLRSPPVLKSPPIVLPCQKAVGKTAMSKTSLTIPTYSETKKKEDASFKKGYGGFFVPSVEGQGKLNYDKDNHSSTKTINQEIPETLCETIASDASDEISEDASVREGHDEKAGKSNRSVSMRDGEIKHSRTGSSLEEEELEGSLPRQGSMGFIVSGETAACESEKSSPIQAEQDSCQNQEKSANSNQKHNIQKTVKVLEKETLNGVEMNDNSKLLQTKDSEKGQPKLSYQDENHSVREFIPSEKTASQGLVSRNTETAVTEKRESLSIKEFSNTDNSPSVPNDSSQARGQVGEQEVLMTDNGENSVTNVKDPIKSIRKLSADVSCSAVNSPDISNVCDLPTRTVNKPDKGNCTNEVHFPSTSSVSGDTSRGPSSSSVSGDTSRGPSSSSVSGDTRRGPSSSSVSGDTRRGPSSSSVSGDTSRGPSSSSVSGDTRRGPSSSSVSGDTSRGPSSSSVSGDTSRGPSSSSVSGDTRRGPSSSSVSGDTSRGSSSSSVSGGTSRGPSSSSVSGDTSRGPSSSSVEGSCTSSLVYIPSLSKLVQKSTFPAVVASSTVLTPEMEDLPSHPHTDNSTTPGSPSTLSTGGPVSPLPPSPFHFFLPNPISPLPPSPIREVAPLSPLCSSPFDLEAPYPSESSSSSLVPTETVNSLQENHHISDSKSSISSSVRKTKIHQHTTVSHVTQETKSSQSFQSGKKIIQSENNTPRTFHAVAPPDAIAVKPQKNKDNIAQTTSAQNPQKAGSKVAVGKKRRSLNNNDATPEIVEKKQCLENSKPDKMNSIKSADGGNLHKVIEAEMKQFLENSEVTCEEMKDKLVLLGDHSTVSSHMLQWTIQYLRCQQVELFSMIHCYCAYSSDCQSRTDPFLTSGEVRLLQFYSFLFQNPDWIAQRRQLLDLLWTSVFSNSTLTLTSRLSLCRMFVGLLYDAGDAEHVRVFFYHVMTCKYLNAAMIAVTIAGVWPWCLYRNTSETSPVLVVMEACIMRELQELQDKGAKISVCLKKLVNWDICVHQNNVLLQHMVKEIEKKCADFHSNQGQIYELRRAVELLLVMQKVGFFKTVFIGVAISPLVNKLKSKQTESVENYVKVIVQIAGGALTQLTTMNEKCMSQIIRKYITKILMSEIASQDVQLSVAQTLLELSFQSPVSVMSGSLYPWFLAHKNDIPAEFVQKMENMRQLLVTHFPYMRCPSFV